MSEDVGLQRAILASLRSAPPPRAAPAPRFSSSFAPVPRRDPPRPQPVSRVSGGRQNTLAKEGIAPAAPRPVCSPSSTAIKKRSSERESTTEALSRTKFIGDSGSPSPSRYSSSAAPSRPSDTNRSRANANTASASSAAPGYSDSRSRASANTSSTSAPPNSGDSRARGTSTLVGGWSLRSGKGQLAETEGSYSVDTPHYAYYVLSREGQAETPCMDFDASLEVQIVRSAIHDGQTFALVVGYQPSSNSNVASFVAIALHAPSKTLRISRVTPNDGKEKVLSESPAPSFSSSWNILSVQVRAGAASVTLNDVLVTRDVNLCKNRKDLCGFVGIGCVKTKALMRHWTYSSKHSSPNSSSMAVTCEPYTGDEPRFVELIQQQIIDTTQNPTHWDDVASLHEAKRLLQEAVVLPLLMPELFTGIRQPWKGVLLFGPPGTGKTLLAKAVASQAKTTFFNISACTLLSKWHGESEKICKVLFNMARHYAPSTIFFDEIDAIMSARGNNSEHESSRRLKTEILTQMDGVVGNDTTKPIMVLAATNKPWDLDEALRRRLEKRIYIPLPDHEARCQMFKKNLSSVAIEGELPLESLADKTNGYSGADITVVCRDASMIPLRRMMTEKTPDQLLAMKAQGELNLTVSLEDIDTAVRNTQPSVGASDFASFEKWAAEFGSV